MIIISLLFTSLARTHIDTIVASVNSFNIIKQPTGNVMLLLTTIFYKPFFKIDVHILIFHTPAPYFFLHLQLNLESWWSGHRFYRRVVRAAYPLSTPACFLKECSLL